MAFGAPLLAAAIGGWDRRRLLVLALVWYALGHALSALMPNYALLTPVRALCMLGAAVFTPQAAAVIGALAPPQQRGRAITFIFLGWSLASVFGMPLHSYIGETFGWRYAFALVALLAAGGAVWVWAVLPDGVRPPELRLRAWKDVFTHPVLMAIVLVTALSGAGSVHGVHLLRALLQPGVRRRCDGDQPAVRLVRCLRAARQRAACRATSIAFGAARAVACLLALIALSMLLWPLAHTATAMALVLMPWALGCFSSNSAQQARLGLAAPALAPALMALNTSAIYLGQAVGAAGGGAIVAASQLGASNASDAFGPIHWVGLAWLLAALARQRLGSAAHAQRR